MTKSEEYHVRVHKFFFFFFACRVQVFHDVLGCSMGFVRRYRGVLGCGREDVESGGLMLNCNL